MHRIRLYGPTIVLMITVIVVMIAGPGLVRHMVYAQKSAQVHLIKNNLVENVGLSQLSAAFQSVADAVETSVVHIEIRSNSPRRSDLTDEFFRRFSPFGRERPQRAEPKTEDDYDKFNPSQPVGNGSGWVYNRQGHIITNRHVVQDAERIVVQFADGTECDAEVVNTDWRTDIAVIKVDTKGLLPATIASNPVQQGEIVFAFGSPLGFQFSMSQGIVSGKSRFLGITGRGGYDDHYIQTDAAINRGNSGGPLVNIYGKVVGMNTAIASGQSRMTLSGGFIGLGFAIPVDVVQAVADQIITNGQVKRGYLGIAIETLSPRMAKTFGFEGLGVLVHYSEPGTPAAEAGLQPDDIITAVNGRPIESDHELRSVIAQTAPGVEVELTIFRNGASISLPVTLAELPEDDTPRLGHRHGPTEKDDSSYSIEILRKFGIESAETFSEELADRLDVDFHEGVLIRQIRSGSVADLEGLSPRRETPVVLIVSVQGSPVATVNSLATELNRHKPSKPIRIRIEYWDRVKRNFVGSSRVLELPGP